MPKSIALALVLCLGLLGGPVVADDLATCTTLPRHTIRTIYNPVVDTALQRQASQPLEHPWFSAGSAPVILGVGRLTAQKDFATLLRAFAPELLIISAGFDAHKDEPIGGLNLDEDDFAWITHQLVNIADEVCSGRIVSSLEGGYNLSALATSALAHVKALLSARY